MAPKRKAEEAENADGGASGSGGEDTVAEPSMKRGRGRPKKTDSEKKAYMPTGKPRGRPRTKEAGTNDATHKRGRGRPSLSAKTVSTKKLDTGGKRGRKPLGKTPKPPYQPTGKPRGRPRLNPDTHTSPRLYKTTGKSRGRPRLNPDTAPIPPYKPTGKPRGRPRLNLDTITSPRRPYKHTGKPWGRPRLNPDTTTPKSNEATPKRGRGRPPLSSKKPYSGKKRGRRPLGDTPRAPYQCTGKSRGRPRLNPDTHTSPRAPYQYTGKPRGRPRLNPDTHTSPIMRVKRKYTKKAKFHTTKRKYTKKVRFHTTKGLQTSKPVNKNSSVQRPKKRLMTVKPLKPVKAFNALNKTNNVKPAQRMSLLGSLKPTPPQIYTYSPIRGTSNGPKYPSSSLNDFQRSVLHVNHSKQYLNYESDHEPALDVLQKKLLAVNTQLIETEEQKLELEKRVIIIKQRKIELERKLLNYVPRRRVLTRIEHLPIIDIEGQDNNNKDGGSVEQGAKIQGWVRVQDIPTPSGNGAQGCPQVRFLSQPENGGLMDHTYTSTEYTGPKRPRGRPAADEEPKKEEKPKKTTSRVEKRGRPRKNPVAE